MAVSVSPELIGASNNEIVLMGGCYTSSVTTAGFKLCAFGNVVGAQLNYPCPGPGVIDNINGTLLASSGSGTAQVVVYKQTGGTGSFTATTAATTAITVSSSQQAASYQRTGTSYINFAAGDVLALYIVPSTTMTMTCGMSLGVRMCP